MKFHTSFLSFSYQGQRDYQQDRRYPQEDAVCNSTQQMFAVCDGMGGTERGEVASCSVINTIKQVHDELPEDYLLTPEDLSSFLHQAYHRLDAEGQDIDTGTTLALLWLHRGGCAMVHLGDSRVYQFRKGEGIVYRSKDHSLVSELVEMHAITPLEAQTHPQRNIITRCMEPSTQKRNRDNATALFTTDIQEGDIFVVCSDGVTGEVDDESLAQIILADGTLESKSATIAAFCENASDNATAILVEVNQVDKEEDEAEPQRQQVEITPQAGEVDRMESTSGSKGTNVFKRLLNMIIN